MGLPRWYGTRMSGMIELTNSMKTINIEKLVHLARMDIYYPWRPGDFHPQIVQGMQIRAFLWDSLFLMRHKFETSN